MEVLHRGSDVVELAAGQVWTVEREIAAHAVIGRRPTTTSELPNGSDPPILISSRSHPTSIANPTLTIVGTVSSAAGSNACGRRKNREATTSGSVTANSDVRRRISKPASAHFDSRSD